MMMREDIISKRGYDANISGNELSIKIASYPATAEYLATRLQGHGGTICELCCGIGVSLVALAKSFNKVIGVDNDAEVIADCKKNLENAGIKNYELLEGDVSSADMFSQIDADVVLYDIPYWSNHGGKVDPNRQNPDLRKLIGEIRRTITKDIVIYSPPHFDYEQVKSQLGECECLEVYINGRHDRNFIFLGDVMQQSGVTQVQL